MNRHPLRAALLITGLLSALMATKAAAQPNLLVSASSLEFVTPNAAAQPAQQRVFLASSGAPLLYEAKTGYWSTATNWLSVTPALGTAPETLTLTIDPTNLARGLYFGYVEIFSGPVPSTILNVTLRVGDSSAGASRPKHILAASDSSVDTATTLTAIPESLTFSYQTGTVVPPPQSVVVSYGRAKTGFVAASSAPWLTLASPTTTTPGQVIQGRTNSYLLLSVDPSSLSSGTYSASVSLSVPGQDERSLPVTLNIGENPFLVAQPGALAFRLPTNDVMASPQTVTILSTSGALNYTASGDSSSWLAVGPQFGSTSGSNTLSVAVNRSNLSAGTHTGFISVSAPGVSSDLTIPVTIAEAAQATVYGLSADPTAIDLQGPLNGPAQTKTVQLTSSLSAERFFVATLPASATWLTVSPSTGTAPATLTVRADPSKVSSAGKYTGYLDISGDVEEERLVTVTFTVTTGGTQGGGTTGSITATPSSIFFSQTAGGTAAPSQTISLSAGTATSFTASSGAGWLTVMPTSGTTPATLTLSVNAAGLNAATYQTNVTITGGTTAVTVPVMLTVSSGSAGTAGSITATPSSVSFSQTAGGTAAPSQTVQLASSTPASFTTSFNASWLTVTPTTGTTPATLTLSVNAAGLNPGSYPTTLMINAGTTATSVPVNLTVSSGTTGGGTTGSITATPSSVSFSLTAGGNPFGLQSLRLDSDIPTNFTASSAASWLTLAPTTGGVTPGTLIVSVNGAGLPAGTYQSTITINGGAAAISVPVTLTVAGSATSTITPTPSSVSFAQIVGGTVPASQTIQLASGTPTNFTAAATASWLTVRPTTGTTPATLTFSANAAGLNPGTYQSTVTINGGATAVSVPVTLTVSNSAIGTITATPSSVSFSQTLGGTAPPSQTIQVASGTATTFTAAAAASWLTVAPATGTTPATLTLSANAAGLNAGTYQSTVTINGGAAAVSVPVTLTVSNSGTGGTASVSPNTLAFSAPARGQTPQAQTLSVTSSGAQFAFVVAARTADSGNWLTVTPASGNTPASLTVAVTPSALTAGQYMGSIIVSPSDPSVPVQIVSVTLTVTGSGGGGSATPQVRSILGAATLLPGPVAPGEIITITGFGLGPAIGAGPNVLVSGAVDSVVAQTRVLFDGTPAPLLFVRSDQINAIVPYSIFGRLGANIQVEVADVRSDPVDLRVTDTAPGIFTTDGSGRGQGAIVNQNGTINSPFSPAARDSIISIYATGEGQTRPPGQDGRIITTDLRAPMAPVSVRIDGVPVEVRYSGSAPGLVSGAFQINVYLPPNMATGGQLPIEVQIGGVLSQLGVTMAVK